MRLNSEDTPKTPEQTATTASNANIIERHACTNDQRVRKEPEKNETFETLFSNAYSFYASIRHFSLRYNNPSGVAARQTHCNHEDVTMSRTAVGRNSPRPAAFETAVLRHLTTVCSLCGRVMSWAFGLLPNNNGGNKSKSHEGSQRNTEKLQGFHALAEVICQTMPGLNFCALMLPCNLRSS